MFVKKLKEGTVISTDTTVNLELGGVKVKKGAFTKLAAHYDEEELYLVLKGKAKVFIDKENRTVKKNDVVYVPIGKPHNFKSLSNDFEYIYIATWPGRKIKK